MNETAGVLGDGRSEHDRDSDAGASDCADTWRKPLTGRNKQRIFNHVKPKARHALATIRDCLTADRFIMLPHFMQRMEERGMAWGDVLAVFDKPSDLRDAGKDDYGRPKWIASGTAVDGLTIEIVCVLDVNEQGDLTVFITIY